MSVSGLVLLLCCGWSLCQMDTSKFQRQFITVFMENRGVDAKYDLYFVTQGDTALVNIKVLNPSFQKTLTITSNSMASVTFDSQYMITGTQLSSKVVMVTSDVAITVFGFYMEDTSGDATQFLPVEDLGQEYFIFTPSATSLKQFAVASGLDRVDWVDVTLSGPLTYDGKSYQSGDVITFSLEPQQVVQFQSDTDLTGSGVVASAPVAVFSGHKSFSTASSGTDTLLEQMHPVRNWGTFFTVFPLIGHTRDVIDIMAANEDTVVKVDEVDYTLQSGSHVQLTLQKSSIVNSSKPIMISYVFQDRVGSLTYDPFFITVPPVPLTGKSYRFVTLYSLDNYIQVVSQAPSASGFYLDNKSLQTYKPYTKDMNGYRIWELYLGKTGGRHEIYHSSFAFHIFVYGLGSYVSYGYSMGQERRYPEPKSPVLNCFSHGAEFHLPFSLVSDARLNMSDIHLEDSMCKGTRKGIFMVIKVPFKRCGSKVLTLNGKTTYVNTVYGTIPGSEVNRIKIPLKCAMEANKTLSRSLHPQVTDMVSLGIYNVSMNFYPNEDFTDVITAFPYQVHLHSRLYVEFKIESDDKDLHILVEDFKASPSLEDTGKNYSIIQHGGL